MSNLFKIMGILNITPDSFYDGGKFNHLEVAAQRIQQMIEEGVDIIDIGGQSALETEPISETEELERVLPVVEMIRSDYPEVQISVDTSKASVAAAAIEKGVHIINDITAGRADPNMLATVAQANCQYVIMYNKDTTSPARIREVNYEDVMQTLYDFFEERIKACEKAGMDRSRLIIDPGLGHFISNDGSYSWEVLGKLNRFQDFNCPILVSPSRKSFTAQFPGQPPAERLPGTLKATKLALKNGAIMVRTHDVGKTRKILT